MKEKGFAKRERLNLQPWSKKVLPRGICLGIKWKGFANIYSLAMKLKGFAKRQRFSHEREKNC
jgi:hypothetical protein